MIRKARTITGRVVGPRTVELDEAVEPIDQTVEVRLPEQAMPGPGSIQVWLDRLRSLPIRGVPKEELDRQLREERDSWGDR